MRAMLENPKEGTVVLRLDAEAARAVFASVLFAARFHDSFAPLIRMAKQGLDSQRVRSEKGRPSCQ
jgi:hypothetical protein